MTFFKNARPATRLLCALLAALLLFSGTFSFAQASEPTTQSLADLQDKSKQIESDLKKNKAKLNQVNQEKKAQKQTVSNIYSQIGETADQINLLTSRLDLLKADIGNTTAQINVITGQIRSLDQQIKATESAIADKQTALSQAYLLLKARIRAMYMAGNGTALEFLLTAQDFSTLLTRTELLMRVAQHDNDLMATIENDIGELETLKTSLNGSKEEVKGKKAQLDSRKAALDTAKQDVESSTAKLNTKQKQIKAQYSDAQKELNALNKQSAEYVPLIRQQEKELDKANRQNEERLAQTGSKTTDNKATGSKKMIFPLKCSGVYISSPYGNRVHPITGEYKLHTGTDFAAPGINQKPIYAVRDGVVHTAEVSKGYGNYIVIDHGDGIATLYAHCDSIAVKQGAKVTQGQVIGRVGSTGYATGPHLHFEVRVNGKTTNPMNGYITLPK